MLDCLINLLAFGLVSKAIGMQSVFSSSCSAIDSEDQLVIDPSQKDILSAKGVMCLVVSSQ